jgi:hypothetical protein
MSRGYTTWENDFLSDRWELFREEGELVSVVDKDADGTFRVEDHTGKLLNSRLTLKDAKSEAERLTR